MDILINRDGDTNRFSRIAYLLLISGCVLLPATVVNGAGTLPNHNQQRILQQQRQKALEQQLTPPMPDVRLAPEVPASGRVLLPQERPCSSIHQPELQQRDELPHWLPLQKLANQIVGHCVGSKGINLLMGTLQNRLIDHGYVTTRGPAPAQNLRSGKLILTIVPGKARSIRFTPDSGRDLSNQAAYEVEHQIVGIGSGGSIGSQFLGKAASGLLVGGNGSDSASATAKSAVSEGSIIIRDQDKQQQDMASLSRDTEHACDSISPSFDKEKEQSRLKEIGMLSDIGGQVADIGRTQGGLNALKAEQDKYGSLPASATEKERQAYLAKLRATPEYKKEQEKYGTGSDIQRGIQVSTAALQGNSAAADAVAAGGGELAARAIANMPYPGGGGFSLAYNFSGSIRTTTPYK